MKPLVYLAGKYTAKERLKRNRDALRMMGFDVTSSWMDTEYPEIVSDEIMAREAARDINEVLTCDMFILDTFDESATGGREVELGIALSKGKAVYIVGPKRNVFHYLDIVEYFSNWDELTERLS